MELLKQAIIRRIVQRNGAMSTFPLQALYPSNLRIPRGGRELYINDSLPLFL